MECAGNSRVDLPPSWLGLIWIVLYIYMLDPFQRAVVAQVQSKAAK